MPQRTIEIHTNNNHSIPYSVAKSCVDRKDKFEIISVSWDGAPESTQWMNFKTISPKIVIVPPQLPLGYKIEEHPSWEKLLNLICDRAKITSADEVQLDRIQHDYDLVIATLDLDRIGNPMYTIRQDYLEYRSTVDESWYKLKHDILDSIGNLFSSCWEALDIQHEAPSRTEALKKMFPQLSNDAVSAIAEKLTKHSNSHD